MMALYQRKGTVNATELLSRRSRGIRDAGTIIRLNMKVLRALLLQVMEKTVHLDIDCSKLVSVSIFIIIVFVIIL